MRPRGKTHTPPLDASDRRRRAGGTGAVGTAPKSKVAIQNSEVNVQERKKWKERGYNNNH
jgi:hypothetical protein